MSDMKHVDDDYSDDEIEVAPKARGGGAGGLTAAASVGRGLAVKDDKLRMAASAKNLKAEEEAEARGTDVAVRFHLPGGKVLETSVRRTGEAARHTLTTLPAPPQQRERTPPLTPTHTQMSEGQVVAALKAYVAENSELPMGGMVLTLGGTVLLDPMSLCDYPVVRARKGALDVEVRST